MSSIALLNTERLKLISLVLCPHPQSYFRSALSHYFHPSGKYFCVHVHPRMCSVIVFPNTCKPHWSLFLIIIRLMLRVDETTDKGIKPFKVMMVICFRKHVEHKEVPIQAHWDAQGSGVAASFRPKLLQKTWRLQWASCQVMNTVGTPASMWRACTYIYLYYTH